MMMSFFERLRRLLQGREGRNPAPEDPASEDPGAGSLSCMEALAKVQEYLDGELADAEAAEVARHFEICRRCYPHLRLEERFRAALRESGARDTCPEEVRARVLEILEGQGLGRT